MFDLLPLSFYFETFLLTYPTVILNLKLLVHWLRISYLSFLPKLTFTNSPERPYLLSTTVLHITYPSDWEHPCPRAMWQNLQGLPELSWRSRHWGSEYCWASRPPLTPSHSCMPWGASTKTECHTIEWRRAGPDVITIMVFPVTKAFWKGRQGEACLTWGLGKDTSVHLRYLSN